MTTLDIVPYDARGPLAFIEERDRIAVALGPLALRIEHHGSTSVVGLAAKPVIDIQVSVATLQPLDRYLTPLAGLLLNLPRGLTAGYITVVLPFLVTRAGL